MTMRRLPDIAIRECVGELRAACRLPIDQEALGVLIERLRPNFERILAHPDGVKRWADHGQRMRRFLGALLLPGIGYSRNVLPKTSCALTVFKS